MNKILVLAFVTLTFASKLEMVLQCGQHHCQHQIDNCQDDFSCTLAIGICFDQCINDPTLSCMRDCLNVSNSENAKQFNTCADKSFCYDLPQLTATCPASCLVPVKNALDGCINDSGYAELTCAENSLFKTNPECAARDCICSFTLQLEQYVVGCYC